VIFLGTSGSIPTPQRSLPAILIKYSGEQLMFDCGEGTQRQIIKAKTGFHRKMKIFISHMHGDHLFGLPGLLQTMSLLKRTRKIEIFGPQGIVDFLDSINVTVPFSKVYPIQVNEILQEGVVCETPKYLVQANWGEHVIPNLVYTFLEKNRWGKFYYPCDIFSEFAKVNFSNSIGVLVPAKTDEYLAMTYGDWKTPNVDFDMRTDCKNLEIEKSGLQDGRSK